MCKIRCANKNSFNKSNENLSNMQQQQVPFSNQPMISSSFPKDFNQMQQLMQGPNSESIFMNPYQQLMFQGMQQMSQKFEIWQKEVRDKTNHNLLEKKSPNWFKILPFDNIKSILEFFKDEDDVNSLRNHLKTIAQGEQIFNLGLRRLLSQKFRSEHIYDSETYNKHIPGVPLCFRIFLETHLGEDPKLKGYSPDEIRGKLQRHFVEKRKKNKRKLKKVQQKPIEVSQSNETNEGTGDNESDDDPEVSFNFKEVTF